MKEVKIKDEFIKLGQAMKLCRQWLDRCGSKDRDTEGQVEVNGEVECRRGKKLHDGDIVSFDGEMIKIVG